MKTRYSITDAELAELYKQLLIGKVGYKEAEDLFDAALRNYDPIQYAVIKAKKELEKR